MPRRIALVTGGSRGIGAATVMSLARRGLDVCFTYRSKRNRADEVVYTARQTGRDILAVASDMTNPVTAARLFDAIRQWTDHLDLLVLNASGGLERDLVAADPYYPMRINRDAQVAFAKEASALMPSGSTVVFVTSHWAHLYGQVTQLPAYEPVVQSKHAGERALRCLFPDAHSRVRLLVVTGDIVEGTITPLLLERVSRGIADQRRQAAGKLPTADDMAEAIAEAALNSKLPSGHTLVVGGPLETLIQQLDRKRESSS